MADYDGLDGDEDNDQQEESWRSFLGRDAIIYLIDASENMYGDSGDDQASLMKICLKCIDSSLKDRIIASGKDLVGVVLFTTAKENQEEFKHITVFRELSVVSSEFVKAIEDAIRSGGEEFKGTKDAAKNFKLSEALWICSDMFKNCKNKLASKRIILFTNNDAPHSGKPDLQRQARQKAQDLRDSDVDIELLPLGASFDVKVFYHPIVKSYEERPVEKLQQLQERVRRRNYKRRPNAHVGFELAPGVKLSVEVYNLVRTLHKPTAIKVNKQTNEEVTTMTNTYTKDTGRLLMAEDVVKTQEYGGKKFSFSAAEARDVKSILKDPIIRLVGFKKKSEIRREHHVAPASFIYPDEKSVKGSVKLFKALLDRCVEKEVVPIAWFMPRRNVNLRLTALMPQKEVKDGNEDQILPPGFHVVPLPYHEDIRNVQISSGEDEKTELAADPEQIAAAREVIEKMKTEYSDTMFENPSLQKHWRNIESLALDKKEDDEDEEKDEFRDTTLPDFEGIEKKAGGAIRKLKNAVYPSDYDPSAKPAKKPAAPRRRLPSPPNGEHAGGGKRGKKDAGDVDMSEFVKDGKVEKLTVDVLKQYLHGEGIKTTGMKKADLVAQVYSHLGGGSY